jgi:hypothetical protein
MPLGWNEFALTPYPTGLFFPQCFLLNGSIYVCGGRPGGEAQPTTKCWRYVWREEVWVEDVPDLPEPLWRGGGFAIDPYGYIADGMISATLSSANLRRQMLRLNPAVGWEVVGTHATAINATSAANSGVITAALAVEGKAYLAPSWPNSSPYGLGWTPAGGYVGWPGAGSLPSRWSIRANMYLLGNDIILGPGAGPQGAVQNYVNIYNIPTASFGASVNVPAYTSTQYVVGFGLGNLGYYFANGATPLAHTFNGATFTPTDAPAVPINRWGGAVVNVGPRAYLIGGHPGPVNNYAAHDSPALYFGHNIVAPTNLQAVASGYAVALTWQDNSDNETGFIVERRINYGTWARIADLPAGTTAYTDENLPADPAQLTYRVRAYALIED